jgi:hypothetical protein
MGFFTHRLRALPAARRPVGRAARPAVIVVAAAVSAWALTSAGRAEPLDTDTFIPAKTGTIPTGGPVPSLSTRSLVQQPRQTRRKRTTSSSAQPQITSPELGLPPSTAIPNVPALGSPAGVNPPPATGTSTPGALPSIPQTSPTPLSPNLPSPLPGGGVPTPGAPAGVP